MSVCLLFLLSTLLPSPTFPTLLPSSFLSPTFPDTPLADKEVLDTLKEHNTALGQRLADQRSAGPKLHTLQHLSQSLRDLEAENRALRSDRDSLLAMQARIAASVSRPCKVRSSSLPPLCPSPSLSLFP